MFFDFKISGVFIGPDFNIYHISDFGLPIDKFTLGGCYYNNCKIPCLHQPFHSYLIIFYLTTKYRIQDVLRFYNIWYVYRTRFQYKFHI